MILLPASQAAKNVVNVEGHKQKLKELSNLIISLSHQGKTETIIPKEDAEDNVYLQKIAYAGYRLLKNDETGEVMINWSLF